MLDQQSESIGLIAFLAGFGITIVKETPISSVTYTKGRFQIRADYEWFWNLLNEATDATQAITAIRPSVFDNRDSKPAHERIYYARESDVVEVVDWILSHNKDISIAELKSGGHWDRSFMKLGSSVGELDITPDRETEIYFDEINKLRDLASQVEKKYGVSRDDRDGIIATNLLGEAKANIKDQLPLAIAFLKYAGAEFVDYQNQNNKKEIAVSDWRIEISDYFLDENPQLSDRIEGIFGDSLIMYANLSKGDFCFITRQSAIHALNKLKGAIPEFTTKSIRGIEREGHTAIFYKDKTVGTCYINESSTGATLFLTKGEIVRLSKVIREEMGITGDEAFGLDATHQLLESITFDF